MAGTDFYDDDLNQPPRGPGAPRGLGGEGRDKKAMSSDDALAGRASDLNLTGMRRHQKDVTQQATQAVQELEMLKQRQEQLERERKELEQAQRQHDTFTRGKKELSAYLRKSLTSLDRDQVETQRYLEVITAARGRFREMLEEIDKLDEDGWDTERVSDELVRGLTVLEDSRGEYNRTMARLEAMKSRESDTLGGGGEASASYDLGPFEGRSEARGFVDWLKIGAAVTLPLIVALAVLLAVYAGLVFNGYL